LIVVFFFSLGLDQDGFVAAMQQLRLDLPEWKIRETFEEFDADDR